jgi:GNAT superfamily N-acetyltransferase
LQREGLVRIDRSTEDARVRSLALTRAGIKELATLNRLSDEAAAGILEPLNKKQRSVLKEAMATVDRLLRASAVTIQVEDPGSRAAIECVSQYYRELAKRFKRGFDPGRSISATPNELTPPRGYFVVARLNGTAVGCGALKCHADFGEIKRMWVAASSRGLGIGRRILLHLEKLARRKHLRVLRLETNSALVEAQALYKGCGYREVPAFNSEPYAHHWFEKAL